MEGDDEVKILIKIWITVFASLTFCYILAKKINKGITRLLFILPLVSLFTVLPLSLSSVHFGAVTAFFLTWLCNFKLLLFAFDQGPLSSNPSLSLLHFIAIACLPIKLKTQETPSHHIPTKNSLKSPLNYALKASILALVIKSYDYKPFMRPYFILALYCIHVYLAAEIVLVMSIVPARAMFGFEIEPQFDDPYLSTSLQDFWGRRWNLMVTSILRPTVYHPVRRICTGVCGRVWALPLALVATFFVSGLMHELIYFYQSRAKPTWEVTLFFVLQGVSTSLEIMVKRALGDTWRLPQFISTILTLGFLGLTSFELFFAQIVQYQIDVRAIQEYSILVNFIKAISLRPLK